MISKNKGAVRLCSIAESLNVSTFAIVDFLAKNGEDIMNNPNVVLSAKQCSLINESFNKRGTNNSTSNKRDCNVDRKSPSTHYEHVKANHVNKPPLTMPQAGTVHGMRFNSKVGSGVCNDTNVSEYKHKGATDNIWRVANTNRGRVFDTRFYSYANSGDSKGVNGDNDGSQTTDGRANGFKQNTSTALYGSGSVNNRPFNSRWRVKGRYGRIKTSTPYNKKRKSAHKSDEAILISNSISVGDFASIAKVSTEDVLKFCSDIGVTASASQNLNKETILLLAEEFGVEVKFDENDLDGEVVNNSELVSRGPVVTIMGHVDHGKTSFLDYVRKASVAHSESGGITQHIGAYKVKTKDNVEIVFLDTPGHEAFTAMRSRGADVTDVVIIIIAADDGIRPQTKEALSQAQLSGAKIVFAINKIDKEGANPEKVKEELASMNFLIEDWGGTYQCQCISAKTGEGIDELLSKVSLEAEMLNLTAHVSGAASGTVLESSKDQFKGYVNNLLIQDGELKIGDIIVAGTHYGKVKAIFDENNKSTKSSHAVSAVRILGIDGAVLAGCKFAVAASESDAKDIVNKRVQIEKEQKIRGLTRTSMEDIEKRLSLDNYTELNIIVKGDVYGSVQALSDSLLKLSTDSVSVKVIQNDVGAITDNDVLLASTANALIIGFNVKYSPSSAKLAKQKGINAKFYSVIYDAINDVEEYIGSIFKDKFVEQYKGKAEVKATFNITKVGMIAGCSVIEGPIYAKNNIKIIRNGNIVFTGKIKQLKHFKTSIKEAKVGMECGISIEKYNDFEVGDIIECFDIVNK